MRFISRTAASMAAASISRPRALSSSSTYWYLVLPLPAPYSCSAANTRMRIVESRYSCCCRLVLALIQGMTRSVIQLVSSAIYAWRTGVRSMVFIGSVSLLFIVFCFQGIPCQRTDDAVRIETRVLLKLYHGGVSCFPKAAIDAGCADAIAAVDQHPLNPADTIAGMSFAEILVRLIIGTGRVRPHGWYRRQRRRSPQR